MKKDYIGFGYNPAESDNHFFVLIGDDPKDVEAAHAAGAHSVAVTWGTSDREALVASGAEELFDTVEELHDFLDRLTRP